MTTPEPRRVAEVARSSSPAPAVGGVAAAPPAPRPVPPPGAAAAKPVLALANRADSVRPGNDDKIVGAPVFDIAPASGSPASKLVACVRCHGLCVVGTRFCKFCGAPLPEPGSTSGEAASEAARRRDAVTPSEPPARKSPAPTAPSAASAEPHAGALAARGQEAAPQAANAVVMHARAEADGGPVPSLPSTRREVPTFRERRDGPAPAEASNARLVVIVEDGSEGRVFPLAGKQVDIGRAEGEVLLDGDLYVSPRHARLLQADGRWTLRDLDSTNRVYLRARKPLALRDGDLLLLGLEVLQFQAVSDAERGLGHASQHGTLLFGSPATHRRARLCQRTVEGVVRDVYHLFRDETVIGRETGDIVFTGDPFLSRRHAMIRRNPTSGEFSLVDLDSSNGTYVAIRGDVGLVNGDYLRIGQHLFRVDLG